MLIQEKISSALRTAGDSFLTPKDLALSAGVALPSIYGELTRMHRKGLLVREGELGTGHANGQGYRYRLSKQSAPLIAALARKRKPKSRGKGLLLVEYGGNKTLTLTRDEAKEIAQQIKGWV